MAGTPGSINFIRAFHLEDTLPEEPVLTVPLVEEVRLTGTGEFLFAITLPIIRGPVVRKQQEQVGRRIDRR